MERLKTLKHTLLGCIEGQMSHLETVDTKELGEVIDMVKDLEEAMYYCTITKAMEEKEKNGNGEHHYYYYDRDMDRDNGRMYYDEGKYYRNGSAMGAFAGNTHTDHTNGLEYPMMRDSREGRSPLSRKTYMESKQMHQPKTAQMKELEKYLHELGSDITEMIEDASPEEKAFMEKKISALAAKINQQ